jgi:hypothetical protein
MYCITEIMSKNRGVQVKIIIENLEKLHQLPNSWSVECAEMMIM